MNKGYVIVLLDVKDQDLYAEYVKQATITEAKHGGRALVVADALEVIEGDWPAERVVVLEFPSIHAARDWYRDPEYAALIGTRQRATNSAMLFVEGFEEPV